MSNIYNHTGTNGPVISQSSNLTFKDVAENNDCQPKIYNADLQTSDVAGKELWAHLLSAPVAIF